MLAAPPKGAPIVSRGWCRSDLYSEENHHLLCALFSWGGAQIATCMLKNAWNCSQEGVVTVMSGPNSAFQIPPYLATFPPLSHPKSFSWIHSPSLPLQTHCAAWLGRCQAAAAFYPRSSCISERPRHSDTVPPCQRERAKLPGMLAQGLQQKRCILLPSSLCCRKKAAGSHGGHPSGRADPPVELSSR